MKLTALKVQYIPFKDKISFSREICLHHYILPSRSLTDEKEYHGAVFSSMDISDEKVPVINDQ